MPQEWRGERFRRVGYETSCVNPPRRNCFADGLAESINRAARPALFGG